MENKKVKIESFSKLKKKLDKVFSEFIRRRDDGQCFTCTTKKPYKQMQCGHYIPRNNLQFRWNEKNCNCQCCGCNIFKKGNYIVYRENLVKKYGEVMIQMMEADRHKPIKLGTNDLKVMVVFYQQQLDKMNKEDKNVVA